LLQAKKIGLQSRISHFSRASLGVFRLFKAILDVRAKSLKQGMYRDALDIN
jgi:hypothetical protein